MPVGLMLALAFSITVGAQAADGDPAAVANHWLHLVDHADYAASWREATPGIQSRVALADWPHTLAPTREPLGAVVSRKLAGEQEAHVLPGAPDGDYRILKFDTRFANKRAATETLVLKHDPGAWAVAGYFIR